MNELEGNNYGGETLDCEIAEMDDEIASIDEEVSEMSSAMNEMRDRITHLERQLADIVKAIDRFKVHTAFFRGDISRLEQQLTDNLPQTQGAWTRARNRYSEMKPVPGSLSGYE